MNLDQGALAKRTRDSARRRSSIAPDGSLDDRCPGHSPWFPSTKTTRFTRPEEFSTLGTFCVSLVEDRIHPDQTSQGGLKPITYRCGEPPCDLAASGPERFGRPPVAFMAKPGLRLRIRQLTLIKAHVGQLASSTPTCITCIATLNRRSHPQSSGHREPLSRPRAHEKVSVNHRGLFAWVGAAASK